MKKIHTVAWLAIASLAISSCSKDLGNYDYKPKEVITIKGIEDSYTRISKTDRITIDPTITSTEGNTDFDCFWGIYETNFASLTGELPQLDTISKTKALDYFVKQPAKTWMLVFSAKNKATGFSQYIRIPLNVITPSTRGWFVLKDDGSQSDIDMFNTPSTIIADGNKVENIYSLYNEKKLEGKASLFCFTTKYRANENGINTYTRTLFAVTDKDVSAISINSFKELRNLDGLFYEKPSVKSPGFVHLATNDLYLQNDGGLHIIANGAANTGLFGPRKLKDAQNTAYKLSKYFITTANMPFGNGPFCFDETSSSFLSGNISSSILTAVTDIAPVGGKPQTDMSSRSNNKKLLFMGVKTDLGSYGVANGAYAYFQDKTNPNLKILSGLTLSLTAFKMVNDTVKATDKIFNATRFALLQGDESMIYFANGNEIWSRNLSNKAEKLQYTVPAGEEITFIRHRKNAGTGSELPFSFNYVMIGTKIGGNYKVRMFTKASGNLNPTPAFTLDGKGSVGDVIYLSPAILDYSFNNTF